MTKLFKDLTIEQQERLVEVFNEVVYIPEDATHIDLGWHSPHTNCVMKLDSNWNMYYLCNETDCVDDFYWKDECNIGRIKLFPIPDDFNRQTGEIMNMDKPLPTEPFVNPLITEDCYVDVQGWTDTEVKLAAEIFAKSTGRKILDYERALYVGSHWKCLGCSKEEGRDIFVDRDGSGTKLTKDQVFWPELTTQPDFPDFDFKLSCGDRPEVRQWLKDNGCVWGIINEDLTKTHLDNKYLCVRGYNVTWVGKRGFVEKYLPEIQPTLTVTGFTVPESEKKRKETLDKIKEKEDTIKRLTDEINQLRNL